MNEKALDILNSFVLDKKIVTIKSDYWEDKLRIRDGYYDRKNIGPFYEEDVWDHPDTLNKLVFDKIPERLYNKKFSIGEFQVHIQYISNREVKKSGDVSSYGTQHCSFTEYYTWNVVVVYCGVHLYLGRVSRYMSASADHCTPKQTNWSWLFPTEDKPYILNNYSGDLQYVKFEKFDEFFETLDLDSLSLEDDELPKLPWYDFSHGKKIKSLDKINVDTIDYETLIKREIKKNVYVPERATVDRLLFASSADSWRDGNVNNIDRNILKKLGVDTIQLRADSHFKLERMFDLKDITIKAPQKVIERYGYEKKKIDPNLAEKIKKDREQEERDYKLGQYNNEFSLVQHGKTILNKVQGYEIINFLENFNANEKNFDEEIKKGMQPIFDAYTTIDKFYISYWGTFYKYESRGSRLEPTFCESANEHIDEDILIQINELYEIPSIDKDAVEIKYGWPDQGGLILGVKKGKTGKLSLFVEDYDFE